MVAACAIILPHIANATLGEDAQSALASILQAIVSGLGKLAVAITDTIVTMASYNGFINSPTVIYGWVLVRDMVNMVFVIILLIIAIATILPGLETYNYKKLLPKVIILAILVNFSRTICGLAIDAAQVVMLTFVAGFKDIGPGNMMAAVGLADLLSFSPTAVSSSTSSISNSPVLDIIAIYLYAILYLIVLILVLVSMVVMLAYRIVMLWLLIVLSPLFYAMQAIPSASGKASMWSGEFVKYLIGGPILAFFIWLSMASFSGAGGLGQPGLGVTGTESTQVAAGIGESGTPGFLTNFIVSIGLLVGGMTITAQMGVGGAKFGQNLLSKAKGIGLSAAKIATVGAAGLAARQAWRGTKAAAGNLNQTLYAKTGRRIVNPVERWQAYKAHREEVQKQKKITGDVKFAGKMEQLQEKGGVLGQARAAIFRAGNSPQAHYEALRASKQGRLKNIYDAAKIGGMSKDEARAELTNIEQKKAALQNQRGDLVTKGQTGFDAETEQQVQALQAKGTAAGIIDAHQAKRAEQRQKMTNEDFEKAGTVAVEKEFKQLAGQAGFSAMTGNSTDNIQQQMGENQRMMDEMRAQRALHVSGKSGATPQEDKEQIKQIDQQLPALERQQQEYEKLLPLARLRETGGDTKNLVAKERRLRNFITPATAGEAGKAGAMSKEEALKKYPDGVVDPNKLGEDLARAFANKAGPDIAVLLEKAMKDGTIATVMNKQGYAYSREGVEKFRTEMLMGKLLMSSKASVSLLKSLGDAGANRSGNPDAMLHSIYGYEKGQNVVKSEEDGTVARFDLLTDRYKGKEPTLQNTNGNHLGGIAPDGTKTMDAAGIDWIVNARQAVERTIDNGRMSQGTRDWIVQNNTNITNEIQRRKSTGEIDKDEKIDELIRKINKIEKVMTKEEKRASRLALAGAIKRGIVI